MNILRQNAHTSAARVETALAHTLAMLADHPELDQSPLGYPGDISHALESTFVPNIRDGVISIPKEYQDSDYFPVVGLSQRSTYIRDDTFDHLPPVMRQTAVDRIDELSEGRIQSDGIHEMIDARPPMLVEKGSMHPDIDGKVVTSSMRVTNPKLTDPFRLYVRPLMILNTGTALRPKTPSIGTTLHETVHLLQNEALPVELDSKSGRAKSGRAIDTMELESYAAEAVMDATLAHRDPTHIIDPFVAAVNSLRETYADPSRPYELPAIGSVAFYHAGLERVIGSELPAEVALAYKIQRHRRRGGSHLGVLKVMLAHQRSTEDY